MPAGLPGSTHADNTGDNPDEGRPVMMDGLSGPKGSPFDRDSAGNASTGAMSTGIGWGLNCGPKLNVNNSTNPRTAAQSIKDAGFLDDTGPGGAYANSAIIYIGGGRSVIAGGLPGGLSSPSPYTAGYLPVFAGGGGSRDAGAGPAFTGFTAKWVTAAGAVADGAAVETGFVNRSGVALIATESVIGSASAAQAAAS